MTVVTLFTPRRLTDERGWLAETFSPDMLARLGLDRGCVQENHSRSEEAGTFRGLHFQRPPHAQAKLVRCTRGRIIDYVVDIRRGSPTFGRWVSAELSADNGSQLFIPAGFAHGFLTLEPGTEVIYKLWEPYAPDYESGVRFDDPALGLTWPRPPGVAILSARDAALPLVADLELPFEYDGTPLPPALD